MVNQTLNKVNYAVHHHLHFLNQYKDRCLLRWVAMWPIGHRRVRC